MSQQKFYDVYVSYPPGIDRERINACLLENLPENEANDLIQALAERPQAIIAENCTKDERENAQQYFSYLGLDVIIRHSLELIPDDCGQEDDAVRQIIDQCPVCRTMIDDPETTDECPTCRLYFVTATEAVIERKRIEWEEKVAFEHKKQQEIAHRIQLEKLAEEKRLRKQIRSELEDKMSKETGEPVWASWLRGDKALVAGGLILALVVVLVAAGYFIGQSAK